MISPTSPATTTRKTTPPTVMESPPRVILARRPGRGQHEYGQAGDAGAGRRAGPGEVGADGRRLGPAPPPPPGGREVAPGASQRPHPPRPRPAPPRPPPPARAPGSQ